MEDQAGKGAPEVSSALIQHVQQMHLSENVKTTRLFCDSCGAQNKNNFVLHSLMYYLMKTTSKVNEMQITFPGRGYSFLPAGRIFGRVEELLRKRSTVIDKEEYIDIYNPVGDVKVVLPQLPLKHNITAAKQKDVNNLLEILYGKEWRGDNRLKWYENIVKTGSTMEDKEEVDAMQEDSCNCLDAVQEDSCNCLDDDCGMHI
ncbi:hypothetical protein PR048_003418 [Dryococelus australis]|uniref:Uncharacterized protein n=1 Tax=Dryococelus australis TaxID=614101 RepID=A0ABQ9IQ01_9NEOP|nr:hypothetical protein PR048_003418 [Dryococelus australis]